MVMDNWLAAIAALAARDAPETPAVLVTVAAAQGSVPREPGAKMLVTLVAQFDTIGGGHLELRACEIARAMLAASGATLPARRRIERFPLGPALGQCCGGVVQLAFERVEPGHFRLLAERWRKREDSWRLVALDAPLAPVLCGDDVEPASPALPRFDAGRGCHVMRDDAGRRWLVDPIRARRPELILFGAGHVGAAIVRAMAELPCRVTWVDEREDMFPAHLPSNTVTEATDTPEAVADAAPARTSFLVMTHSHALDQRLAETILRRGDTGWFGLIGSKTKRMQFEHRLRERGIAAARLADMVCPIGIPGITGKEPAVIAAAVCAQLLLAWEQAAHAEALHPATHLNTEQ
jgi:xanthine dehydrogenase accessory factor